MYKNLKGLFLLLNFILFSTVYTINAVSCKDIIACGDATDGDYNLLLKIRDPSRPGLQVLTKVPYRYSYTYTHPWSGKPMFFTVNHSYIGVVTLGDTIPSTVKPGMLFTDAGLAYGDADTMSNWVNPSKFAWDDFDWLRYSAEQASNLSEAVRLLTVDVVDCLHAPGVSENLFVVGSEGAVIIEADAYRYSVESFTNGVRVRSNYPVELWCTQIHKCLPVALSYDYSVERMVKPGDVIHLGSLFGVRITRVTPTSITVRQVPFLKYNERLVIIGKPVVIPLREHRPVGDFDVFFIDYLPDAGALVKVRTYVKAWEEEVLGRLNSRYGSLNITDFMGISRLHSEDLSYLRGLCEDRFIYEGAMIYQIPRVNADLFSVGWFSAGHACSSIYVPVHVVDEDVYAPYTNGEAANLSLTLSSVYSHGALTSVFRRVEEVFIGECRRVEGLAKMYIDQPCIVKSLFTISDTGMQRQAYLTERFYLEYAHTSSLHLTCKDELMLTSDLWGEGYLDSLDNMRSLASGLYGNPAYIGLVDTLIDIGLSIGMTRVMLSRVIQPSFFIQDLYVQAEYALANYDIETGFTLLKFLVAYTS
jgi:hypothetical protein